MLRGLPLAHRRRSLWGDHGLLFRSLTSLRHGPLYRSPPRRSQAYSRTPHRSIRRVSRATVGRYDLHLEAYSMVGPVEQGSATQRETTAGERRSGPWSTHSAGVYLCWWLWPWGTWALGCLWQSVLPSPSASPSSKPRPTKASPSKRWTSKAPTD